jgi:hypothetical protein
MGVAAQIFGLPSLTFASTVESLIIIRFYSDLLPSALKLGARLEIPIFVFLANYAFGLLIWGFIYPRFFSPLRHMVGPRVSRKLSTNAAREQTPHAYRDYLELHQCRSAKSGRI